MTALLRVASLTKTYRGARWSPWGDSSPVCAVRDVGFEIESGTTLGLVGESGCGKTTLARCVLRLVEPDGGEILFDGQSLLDLGAEPLRRLRREMQMVFQDPYSSLNPRMRVGRALAEPLEAHGLAGGDESRRRVAAALERVGLDPAHADRHPHDFSGGQRQRIAIARALMTEPRLLVCDEAVSALDVSVQAQILDLFADIQAASGLTYLFITHDLAVARHVSDRVAVMLGGSLVETAPTDELFTHPAHPYTRALMAAATAGDDFAEPQESPRTAPTPPCPHRHGCEHAEDRCADLPPFSEVGPGHQVRCWLT
jgi:oligopeptide/dipeptide ABC transporter ATP-binding protein